ncbi:hypothetical protein [Nonomuraea sp. NPDC049784]|uniref:hypothetical protein n=1 Tax=Nonomuraea sp. NPDC049784 TaxID=3154361 RepID=UPI0033D1C80C
MTRSSLATPPPVAGGPPPGTPVPVGTTLHPRAWCDGITGGKAYLEAEGRIGAPDGPVDGRAAAQFSEVRMEHFAEHGDLAAATEHQDYEVTP